MPTMLKQWQVRFVICPSSSKHFLNEQMICLYGKSVDELRQTVREYLQEKKPILISNIGDNVIDHIMYLYSDGKSIPPHNFQQNEQWLPEGWWFEQFPTSKHVYKHLVLPQPFQKLKNFDAVIDHFVTYALILEQGPDYRSKAIVKGDFRLPFLERVLREAEEHLVNDLIERGWHIIALEYKGELSMSGELTNREVVFVLGHPEAQAARITLNADYYNIGK